MNDKSLLFPNLRSNESFRTVYQGTAEIVPDGTFSCVFDGKDFQEEGFEYILSFAGEVGIPPEHRCEPEYPLFYRRLDDCLFYKASRPFLRLTPAGGVNKYAYYKISRGELTPGGEYTFSWEAVKGFSMGRVCCQAELFVRTDSKHMQDTPKETVFLNLENPSQKITVPEDIDFILLTLSAEIHNGFADIFTPEFRDSDGKNVIEPFAPAGYAMHKGRWIGHHISLLEKPLFTVTLNGEELFHGRKFDPISPWPSFEFLLPALQEENRLEICYHKDFENRPSFHLAQVQIIRSDTKKGILSHNTVARSGRYPMLIRTTGDNTTVTLSCDHPQITPETDTVRFEHAGIYNVYFNIPPMSAVNVKLFVSLESEIHEALIEQVVSGEDTVITGSSDSIFIPLEAEAFRRFVVWHTAHELGDLFTLRTTYRWSGTETPAEGFFPWAEQLLTDSGLKIAAMYDGRELPSCGNLPVFREDNPAFLGYQTHEEDGSQCYWTPYLLNEHQQLYYEVFARKVRRNGIFPRDRGFEREGETYWYCYNPTEAKNMGEACEKFTGNIRACNQLTTRHSGPSVFFKYFYQAGLDWLCAETMYGTMELVLAALRGASKAYGKKSFGVHHAVQWSTDPHDDIFRYRRFWNALLVSYIQGTDQINTEEGFYRMDAYFCDFRRDSDACAQHRTLQTLFNRFVKSHVRRGEFVSPTAFVQGRYDGVSCFAAGQAWNQQGEYWAFGAPEQSLDLLKTFYPLAVLGGVYEIPCPHKPVGFHTGMPYGPADVIPIEADIAQGYKTLIFTGWNTAREEDIPKLIDFVRQGGTLLLSLAHLYTTVDRREALGHTSDILSGDLTKKLLGIKEFSADKALPEEAVCCGTDFGGQPDEALCHTIGQGRVYLVNRRAYPSESPVYERIVRYLGEQTARAETEKGWLFTEDSVSTAAYQDNNTRVLYFKTIDWWSEDYTPQHMALAWKDKRFVIEAHRDQPGILTLCENTAVMTQDLTTDVISVSDSQIVLQGRAKTTVTLFFAKDAFPTVHASAVFLQERKDDRLLLHIDPAGETVIDLS